jgi:hypothetical protein
MEKEVYTRAAAQRLLPLAAGYGHLPDAATRKKMETFLPSIL